MFYEITSYYMVFLLALRIRYPQGGKLVFLAIFYLDNTPICMLCGKLDLSACLANLSLYPPYNSPGISGHNGTLRVTL